MSFPSVPTYNGVTDCVAGRFLGSQKEVLCAYGRKERRHEEGGREDEQTYVNGIAEFKSTQRNLSNTYLDRTRKPPQPNNRQLAILPAGAGAPLSARNPAWLANTRVSLRTGERDGPSADRGGGQAACGRAGARVTWGEVESVCAVYRVRQARGSGWGGVGGSEILIGDDGDMAEGMTARRSASVQRQARAEVDGSDQVPTRRRIGCLEGRSRFAALGLGRITRGLNNTDHCSSRWGAGEVITPAATRR
ncbi:hypothetical protein C8F04DRAFT_1179582 [Mycena alexandri]|uniref:Uncharacterized protein n=1 Tax=Mycena alexandri TaxID=1745969 RepID=A0AAD6T6B3_9AGAR|nr:hypothetical protein C8F04DRAFT_1179582 [Mycena alexandri]